MAASFEHCQISPNTRKPKSVFFFELKTHHKSELKYFSICIHFFISIDIRIEINEEPHEGAVTSLQTKERCGKRINASF